jgi:outer membrane protein OmpA-like peptidoglycan-associated protein
MSSQSKSRPGRMLAVLSATVAFLCTFATFAAAQDQPAPKWELYGGYSFMHFGADVHGQLPGALFPLSSRLEVNPRGIGASGTYNFNRWLGLTLDYSTHFGSGEVYPAIDDSGLTNFSLGPKVTFRSRHFAPFLEALVGDHRLTAEGFHNIDKLGFMGGGGLDVVVSRHVALRLLRADYVYSNYQYGDPTVTPKTEIRGARLQMGINFMFVGDGHAVSASAACSAQPTEVFAGEPVTATATGHNFNPRHTVRYAWSGKGVKVSGSNPSTQINTTGLQPGSYHVVANLSDGSREGIASCKTGFSVRQPNRPSISCYPDPATVQQGGRSTINSNASSPDNRRLTYSYSTNAGSIWGSDSSATLSTDSAQPGQITVTCNVSDDRNPALTAYSTTTVNVEAPPPAPEIAVLEAKLALHSIYFQTARPTVDNPDGGLVDSQAEILKTLAKDFKDYLRYRPDARLVLSGHADPRGTVEYNNALTQRRVERTKTFLEHAVPDGHIETRSLGKEEQLTAQQIREQISQNPDLSPSDRQQMLNNLAVMVLANNRRVDVSLSTTGQQSTRRYPFNARDYLALISTQGVAKKAPVKSKAKPTRWVKPH